MSIFSAALPVQVAGLAIITSAVIAGWLLLAPAPHRVPAYRRRHGVEDSPGLVGRAAAATSQLIGTALRRKGQTERFANKLDRAGIRRDPADFLLLVGAGVIAGFAVGMVIGGVLGGLALAVMVGVGALLLVNVKADRRKGEFADQLDDLLQLLAGNLRAGHSILQAISSVADELEEPAASEMTRLVNQVRVGRDLGVAVEEIADRMDSDDFRWVAQAIAIHRQVGGNLAEVLDGVSNTIRERGKIRRQVKALAAEGKLSAIILMGLPFVVLLALSFLNPSYMSLLISDVIGFLLIGAGAVSLTIGGLWLRKVVQVEF